MKESQWCFLKTISTNLKGYLSISYIRLVLIQTLAKLILKLSPRDQAYIWPVGIIMIIVIERKERIISGQNPAIIGEDNYKLDNW